MRHVTQTGLGLIKRFEGFSSRVYICAAGYPTVGYGHVVKAGEDFAAGVTEAQALELLARDVQVAERSVIRLISVPLTNNEFDALVSFTFNLGAGALQRSTLRRKLNRNEREAAAEEFLKWVWAGGKKLKGLIRRRDAERTLFLELDSNALPWRGVA